MLILSGIPSLTDHVRKDVQLALLLTPVRFDLIDLRRDLIELNRLAYSYADQAGLCFDPLSNTDFFQRLSYACSSRWGVVIEVIIEALTVGKLAGAGTCSLEHFAEGFRKRFGTPVGHSPFTVEDYRKIFDPDQLLALLALLDSEIGT